MAAEDQSHSTAPREFRATRFGSRAPVPVDPALALEVFASFERSCYAAASTGDILCLGDASIGCGPLNVTVAGFRPPAPGQQIRLWLTGAQRWQAPPPVPAVPAALRALRNAARERAPAEGLGRTIGGASTPLIDHARPALDALAGWLSGAALDPVVSQLIGLGPGLTPSGDDYLGGMLIALAGDPSRRRGLWKRIEPQLEAGTSRISAAHLRAAAAGEGHELLHACLEACGSAENHWPQLLARLDRLGHCSGWDALAGALAALQAQAAARNAS